MSTQDLCFYGELTKDILQLSPIQYILLLQTFLADYGMVWVGDKTSSDSEVYNEDSESDEDMWRPGTA